MGETWNVCKDEVRAHPRSFASMAAVILLALAAAGVKFSAGYLDSQFPAPSAASAVTGHGDPKGQAAKGTGSTVPARLPAQPRSPGYSPSRAYTSPRGAEPTRTHHVSRGFPPGAAPVPAPAPVAPPVPATVTATPPRPTVTVTAVSTLPPPPSVSSAPEPSPPSSAPAPEPSGTASVTVTATPGTTPAGTGSGSLRWLREPLPEAVPSWDGAGSPAIPRSPA